MTSFQAGTNTLNQPSFVDIIFQTVLIQPAIILAKVFQKSFTPSVSNYTLPTMYQVQRYMSTRNTMMERAILCK